MGNVQLYPIIGAAPTTEEGGGIVEGDDPGEETKKRIWLLAQERQIENTPANRALAYKIDGLVRFISNIKRYSILKSYTLKSDDDLQNEALMNEIDTFIGEIRLMSAFLRVFTSLQIEGAGHLQKLLDGNTLTGFAVLENLTKHTNPIDVTDYYYYQSKIISKNWKDPEETELQPQRVWFIDEALRNDYDAIDEEKDYVLSRDLIIEILNSDAGESNLQTVISLVFIKNFLIQLLPNLIEIFTSPSEEIIYDTIDKTGVPCIPTMPPLSFKAVDGVKYAEQVLEYNTWKSNLKTLVNRISADRTKRKESVHPDTITEKILESSGSFNSQLIESLISVLDNQIAYGMNFSLSLITARGAELSTSRNIYSVVAVTMRGIQERFQAIAEEIIYERFPAAKTAGIRFELDELNPEDSLIVAQRNKLNAEVVDILNNVGYDPISLGSFSSLTIDKNLSFDVEDQLPEIEEAAEKVVEGMLSFRNDQLNEE